MTDKSDKEVNVKMDKKIGFIGCGNMGGALALAAAKSVGAQYICVSDADFNKATDFATKNNVNIASAEEVAKTFMSLMGESVTPRKKFIEDNAWRANIDV